MVVKNRCIFAALSFSITHRQLFRSWREKQRATPFHFLHKSSRLSFEKCVLTLNIEFVVRHGLLNGWFRSTPKFILLRIRGSPVVSSPLNNLLPEDHPAPPGPDQSHSGSQPTLGHLGVTQRLEYLRQQFAPAETENVTAELTDGRSRRVGSLTESLLVRRSLKSALALAVAALVVWLPAQRLFQPTSVEAIVNARTLTLRAPIDGVVSLAPTNLSIGTTFATGSPLLRITNNRADQTRFDDLRRLQANAEIETAALIIRLGSIERMHNELVAQTRQFQMGRIAQLEARIQESKSNLAAAATRQEETAAVLERALELDTNGFQPKALLQKLRRDNEIAKQDVRAIAERIKGITVELESARSGSFLGDSYNDRPRSSQRADELEQQIVELQTRIIEKKSMIRQLQADVDIERNRVQLNSEAAVLAPSSGTVWELLTAPGEQVQRGQDLMRLLDCTSALITAVVSETVYNGLKIGSAATFRLRNSDAAMPGRVVNLTGVASAAANYAIPPSSLRKEPYRVVVEVPSLANAGQSCNLGRTGQVVFAGEIVAIPAASQ